ncbi:hypothetical protein NPIL_594531 [Nephila pilipes]|uniref:Uncharacterized protein n=1 Tax=Nephila pilipes TaxID=299642 RepID=A0A8X6MB51_NEPPI|nr:hypothetical protein NPIL_594531 [Nephila pilipes]
MATKPEENRLGLSLEEDIIIMIVFLSLLFPPQMITQSIVCAVVDEEREGENRTIHTAVSPGQWIKEKFISERVRLVLGSALGGRDGPMGRKRVDNEDESRLDISESDSSDFEFSSATNKGSGLENLNYALQCRLNADVKNPALCF